MLDTGLWSVAFWVGICEAPFVQEGLLGGSQANGGERGLGPLETDPEALSLGVGEEVRRAGVGEHRGLDDHSCGEE